MYAEHQPVIAKWCRARPENLARAIQFAIISARQKFINVPALMQETQAGQQTALYGFKAHAYNEAWRRRYEIAWHCEDIARSGHGAHQFENHLLSYLAANVYGLNVAKGGFVCQLAYGVSGCLDSVNVKRLGLPARFGANFFQLKTPQARYNRAKGYNMLAAQCGGAETLWNEWCEFQAGKYPIQFPTAYECSAWHLKCLGIT